MKIINKKNMLKFLKETSGLAIFSFLFGIMFPLFHLANINYLSNLFQIIVVFSPFFAVVFGILALISISLKYITNREFNKSIKVGIILSILGIFIGGFYGLILSKF